MSLGPVFDKLGQRVMPQVATKVFADTMDIVRSKNRQGLGGGRIKGTSTDYVNIPVAVKPYNRIGSHQVRGEKPIALQQYMLTFPTHNEGDRINLDPKSHRLTVNQRGNEPVKVFRIESVRDNSGVIFECVCEREN